MSVNGVAGRGPDGLPSVDARPLDLHDPGYALRARGALGRFNAAGVLHAADVHAADRIAGLVGERGDNVRLALALAIRAVRHGSVCVDLREIETQLRDVGDPAIELTWPGVTDWLAEVAASPLAAVGDEPAARPLRQVGDLIYLDKYWRQERLVAREFDRRSAVDGLPGIDLDRLAAAVERILPGELESRQRVAAITAASRRLVIIAGGPGTGKTTAVARLLAVLADQPGPPPRIALAAPTGKAAARLSEAVHNAVDALADPRDRARLPRLQGVTLHRLLGWRPGNQLRFNEFNRLGADIVVVDEASMLSLTMMARLLAALADDTRLILVGDPDQLESVDAGVVLADLVDRAGLLRTTEQPLRATEQPQRTQAQSARPAGVQRDLPSSLPHDLPAGLQSDLAGLSSEEQALASAGVVTLRHRWRFGDQREIVVLADAIVAGDADRVVDVVRSAREQVEFIELPGAGDAGVNVRGEADQNPGTVLWQAVAEGRLAGVRTRAMRAVRDGQAAARSGDAPEALAVLGSHQILCAHRHGGFGASTWSRQVERWAQQELSDYTRDQPWYLGRPVMMRVNDPDLGIYNGDTGMVIDDPRLGRRVAFAGPGRPLLVNPSRLADVDTVHALTIHKSQGSQYQAVTLILPPLGSPLLTRELLYTAVTRARRTVSIVGTEAALRAAIARPVARASGLRVI